MGPACRPAGSGNGSPCARPPGGGASRAGRHRASRRSAAASRRTERGRCRATRSRVLALDVPLREKTLCRLLQAGVPGGCPPTTRLRQPGCSPCASVSRPPRSVRERGVESSLERPQNATRTGQALQGGHPGRPQPCPKSMSRRMCCHKGLCDWSVWAGHRRLPDQCLTGTVLSTLQRCQRRRLRPGPWHVGASSSFRSGLPHRPLGLPESGVAGSWSTSGSEPRRTWT
jgi:hypothetical protein